LPATTRSCVRVAKLFPRARWCQGFP
jgi:hypothetical protein